MALRPRTLPAWVTRPYGSDELGWSEAVNQCRSTLQAWASSGEPRFYSQLLPYVPAIQWPEGPHTHEGQQMGYLLGQVSVLELDPVEDRPVLSAVVYAKEESLPSAGFWSLLDELGVQVPRSREARERFWLEELRRCSARYRGVDHLRPVNS